MPMVCWVKGCVFIPSRTHDGHLITCHAFPNTHERVLQWLAQLIPGGEEVNALADQILTMKKQKYNKYRVCSLHFAEDNFIVNVGGRVLRPNAIPTVFHNFEPNQRKIDDDLTKTKRFKKTNRDNRSAPESSKSTLSSASSLDTECSGHIDSLTSIPISNSVKIELSPGSKFSDASAQTDYDLSNSIIIPRYRHDIKEEQSPFEANTDVTVSTPLPGCSTNLIPSSHFGRDPGKDPGLHGIRTHFKSEK